MPLCGLRQLDMHDVLLLPLLLRRLVLSGTELTRSVGADAGRRLRRVCAERRRARSQGLGEWPRAAGEVVGEAAGLSLHHVLRELLSHVLQLVVFRGRRQPAVERAVGHLDARVLLAWPAWLPARQHGVNRGANLGGEAVQQRDHAEVSLGVCASGRCGAHSGEFTYVCRCSSPVRRPPAQLGQLQRRRRRQCLLGLGRPVAALLAREACLGATATRAARLAAARVLLGCRA
eukprot:scaffold58197_cov40-Phaeocystis_antarctica.AAC.1